MKHKLVTIGTSALLLGCGGQHQAAERPNVILICLDTVRADLLGTYGHREHPTTPFLDGLAESSIVFEDASATAGWTKPSVPSILTGTFPSQHGVYEGSSKLREGSITDVLPQASVTLAEVFQESGYETAAFVMNAQLRPGNGFEQGFDLYQDEAGDARSIRWHGLDWIDREHGERPFFLYLHFLDAHWPYPIPETYATMFAEGADVSKFQSGGLLSAVNKGEAELEPAELAALEDLYAGAIRYLDDQLALLVQGLRIRGLEEDTIVCIVSDHGEEFGEHGRIGHGHGLWEGLLRVPWILHVPGGEPQRVQVAVSLVDLFPTLLSAARVSHSTKVMGVDRLTHRDAKGPIYAEHKASDRYQHSFRWEGRKLQRSYATQGEVMEIYPVYAHTRWEAELERAKDGVLFATQLKPRDEPLDEPVEIKGAIQNYTEAGFTLGAIPIHINPVTDIDHDDEARDLSVRDGRIVKVRGPIEGGVMTAERVKVYPVGEDEVFEIRGPVDEIDVDLATRLGRIVIGGIEVRIDPATELKNASVITKGPALDRNEIIAILASNGGSGRFDEALYDLARDPLELDPEAVGDDRIRTLLEDFAAQAVRKRVFGDGDRMLLTEEAIQDLRRIGYAE